MDKTFSTPALARYAAGLPVEPIGYLPNGRAVYPIAGGAEAAAPAEQPSALPSADDLAAMTPDALAAHLAAIEAEAADLAGIDPVEMTDAQADRIALLPDHMDAIDADTARREAETQARVDTINAAKERLNRAPADEDTDADAGDDTDAGDDAPAEVDPADAAPEAVAAGGAPAPRRAGAPRPAARKAKVPAGTGEASRFSIVAAADNGLVAAGASMTDLSQAAQAFITRSDGFPSGIATEKGVFNKLPVAKIRRNYAAEPDALWYGNKDYKDDMALLAAAAREDRLSGGSLVAAGGWCAPSTTMYGLTSMETLDGIIDLPSVGVDRGGVSFTPGPNFSDIFASAGFSQTEAQAIAGTTKACVEVDCPDFEEVRLDAVGYCVKAPLLTRTAYPEAIQRWLEGTIIANQHKIAARLIASMRTALGTPLVPVLTGTPITWGTLSVIEWLIEMQRTAYRLSQTETLEVVFPRWVKAAVRADLANRAFNSNVRITDAMITEHFADRGAAVQFVLNYLEPASPLTSIAYPTTFEAMIYPAGTFVKGTADVISLDTVYDTADLQTNVYTAAFVEDGVSLMKMQHGGVRVTLPTNVNGMMGALQIDDNLFTAQVETAGAAAA